MKCVIKLLALCIVLALCASVECRAQSKTYKSGDSYIKGDFDNGFTYKFKGSNGINNALERARKKANIEKARKKIRRSSNSTAIGRAPKSKVSYGGGNAYSHSSGGNDSNADNTAEFSVQDPQLEELNEAAENFIDRAKNYQFSLDAEKALLAERGFRGNFVDTSGENLSDAKSIKRDPFAGVKNKERSIEELIAIYIEDSDKLSDQEISRLEDFYTKLAEESQPEAAENK